MYICFNENDQNQVKYIAINKNYTNHSIKISLLCGKNYIDLTAKKAGYLLNCILKNYVFIHVYVLRSKAAQQQLPEGRAKIKKIC